MTKLGRKPKLDEFTGQRTSAWRWWKRKQKEDTCQRCHKPVPESDVRVSWKSGTRTLVKRRVCSLCMEKEVRSKLYPTKEASK